MSTVLWANYLLDGQVTSDESDKFALYRHAKKLDRLSRRLGVTAFLGVQDTTDVMFNLHDIDLPEGMESTNEMMAKDGTWIAAVAAVTMIETLLQEIESKQIRFGLLSNAHTQVVDELRESLKFAQLAASKSAQFNFAVIL